MIADARGRTLAPGRIGEILMRGPNVMKAYYKDPEAAARALTPDGWLHSGGAEAGRSRSEAELREHCRPEPGPFKTPKLFRFIDELPRGPSGKVQRLRIAEGGNA